MLKGISPAISPELLKVLSEMGHGDEIRVIRCRNEDAEAERVAVEILSLHLRTDRPYSDFAILYRGNYQAKLMELKLQHHQIPYRLSGGTSFFARQEVKDLMSYFRLLVNPDDDNAYLRVINVPRREIGSTTLEKLGNYATERKISMYAATDEIGLGEHLDTRFTDRLSRFKRFMDKVREQCAGEDPISALRSMVMDIDYENWLRTNSSSDKAADYRMGNVWFLIEALKNTLEKDEDGEMTVEDAIGKLVLRDMLERQQEEEDGAEGVQMMTLHASKGLEFPYVFIMGMEEEILPHRSSIEADTIEEERRLAYVGITRARQTLAFTFAAKRKQYGEIIECTPSRFLDELPPEDLQWENLEDAPQEVKAATGKSALDDIQNSFVIITEYNTKTQGFLVRSVERIVNMNWEEIHPPPKGTGRDHYLTAVTRVDNQLVEIIDVEKVLAEVAPTSEAISVGVVDAETAHKAISLRVLTVDDSSVARKQVSRCLQTVGVEVVALNDGKQALDYLRKLVDEGKKPEEEFLMMISDIEMPEMDGYTLTAEIRNDPRMQKLHIILHTSLSGVFNQAMVKKVGADDFLAKFRPDDLASRVVDRIKAADHS